MKIRKPFLVILALFVISQAQAQETSIKIEELKPVALQALDTFGRIVNEQNFKRMGFKSVEEVKTAKLGVPFQEFMVGLDRLQKYESGLDPNQLLDGGHTAYFPINVQTETRSAIIILKEKDRWKPVSYGSANLVKLLDSFRSRLQSKTDLPISSFFVVRIPALNIYFIGFRMNQQLLLTPIIDNDEYKFKSGSPILAEEVFKTLLPYAKAHDGLPG